MFPRFCHSHGCPIFLSITPICVVIFLTGLLFTYPCPAPDKIGSYYKSEDYLSHNEEKKGLFAKIYNIVKKRNIKNKSNIAFDGFQKYTQNPKVRMVSRVYGLFGYAITERVLRLYNWYRKRK